MTLARVPIPSPHYSSRGGQAVRLIVVHTAEGARTFSDLGAFFQQPGSQVSSHVGIDDTPGTVGEYVRRDGAAWTQANANPVSISAELCAFAAWTPEEWAIHPHILDNCAAWIAEEAQHFGIPITKLAPSYAQGSSPGVCAHSDLGSWGGNHGDPGANFPWAQVIDTAKQIAAGSGAPTPPEPEPTPPGTAAPPWPGRLLMYPPLMQGSDVHTWQQQMAARGWSLAVDGQYGPESQGVCRQFQAEKGLAVDGIVGPDTWAATWTAPIT
jgi:N-acetyl-anhydromuramyl-L-alanine amidase AmpD